MTSMHHNKSDAIECASQLDIPRSSLTNSTFIKLPSIYLTLTLFADVNVIWSWSLWQTTRLIDNKTYHRLMHTNFSMRPILCFLLDQKFIGNTISSRVAVGLNPSFFVLSIQILWYIFFILVDEDKLATLVANLTYRKCDLPLSCAYQFFDATYSMISFQPKIYR